MKLKLFIDVMKMKTPKLLGLFVVLLASVAVHAQHLDFMGVPINGTLEQFGKGLQAKGFVLTEDVEGDPRKWYEGTFEGEEVTLVVSPTPVSGTVYGVMAVVEVKRKDEKNAKVIFEKFNKIVVERYGDNRKEYDESRDETHLQTTHYVNKNQGNITVSIQDMVGGYAVSIDYLDIVNLLKKDDESKQRPK